MAIAVLIIIALVVVAALVISGQYRPEWIRNKASASNIRILVPLAVDSGFQKEEFTKNYQDRWGARAFCEPVEGDGPYDTQYMITDSSHNCVLSLKYSSAPLDADITNLLLSTGEKGFTDNKPLTADEKTELKNNQAFVEIECETGIREPIDRLQFTAKVLLSVFEVLPTVGYANTLSQAYRPKAQIREFEAKTMLNRPDLFLLFVNIQIVSGEAIDIHTHGMEQFKLPDLQVAFTEKNETNYHFNVLRTAAVYIVENGDVLKHGHTWQLEGDRTLFKIVPVRKDRQHFGPYGTIGFERTAAIRRG